MHLRREEQTNGDGLQEVQYAGSGSREPGLMVGQAAYPAAFSLLSLTPSTSSCSRVVMFFFCASSKLLDQGSSPHTQIVERVLQSDELLTPLLASLLFSLLRSGVSARRDGCQARRRECSHPVSRHSRVLRSEVKLSNAHFGKASRTFIISTVRPRTNHGITDLTRGPMSTSSKMPLRAGLGSRSRTSLAPMIRTLSMGVRAPIPAHL